MVKLWQQRSNRGQIVAKVSNSWSFYQFFRHTFLFIHLFRAFKAWSQESFWSVLVMIMRRQKKRGRKKNLHTYLNVLFTWFLNRKDLAEKSFGPIPRGVLFLVNLVLLVSRLHNPTWWHVTENDQFSDLITLIWWFCWILWFWWWWLSVGSWSSIVWNYTFVKICW